MELTNLLNKYDEEVKLNVEEAKKSNAEPEVVEPNQEPEPEVIETPEAKDEKPEEAEPEVEPEAVEPEPEAEPEAEPEEASKSIADTKDSKDRKDVKNNEGKDGKDNKKKDKDVNTVDEEDEKKDGKDMKDKKKGEQAKKSTAEADLGGLLETVIKSYQATVETNKAIQAKLESVEKSIASLTATRDEEVLAKSLFSEAVETKLATSEEVEDKAVGYVAKSVTTEPEVISEPEAVAVEPEIIAEPVKETFNIQEDRQQFLKRFKAESSAGNMQRGELESHRESYLKASENRATATELASLKNFISQ